MLMLSCTDVLRPGLGRIGQLTDNIVLPRTINITSAIGGGIGGVIGAIIGAMILAKIIGGSSVVLGSAFAGVMAGIWIVGWEPWKGEHAGRVAWVRTRSIMGRSKTLCPGSSRLAHYDKPSAQYTCPRCSLIIDLEDDLVPSHEWKRQLYDGIMPIPMPQTGVIRFTSGSVLVPKALYKPTGSSYRD